MPNAVIISSPQKKWSLIITKKKTHLNCAKILKLDNVCWQRIVAISMELYQIFSHQRTQEILFRRIIRKMVPYLQLTALLGLNNQILRPFTNTAESRRFSENCCTHQPTPIFLSSDLYWKGMIKLISVARIRFFKNAQNEVLEKAWNKKKSSELSRQIELNIFRNFLSCLKCCCPKSSTLMPIKLPASWSGKLMEIWPCQTTISNNFCDCQQFKLLTAAACTISENHWTEILLTERENWWNY